MKKSFLFLFLLPLFCFGQLKNLNIGTYNFQVGNGATLWGLLGSPLTNDSCALLVFEHGVGEAGNNTEQDAIKLLAYSPLGYLNAGIDFSFTSPATGVKIPFVVMSIQGVRGWVPSSDQIAAAVREIKGKFKIKQGYTFITGLSAGGEATTEAITTPGVMELFSAAVPMSTPSPGFLENIPALVKQGISVWAFHGQQDGGLTSVYNTYKLQDAIKALNPSLFRGTYPPNDGHCCWATYYNPTYREIVDGKSMNIYEWMLYKAGKGGGSVVVPPVVLPPSSTPVNAGKDTSFANQILLSGSSSIAGAYSWQKISGPGSSLWTNTGRWDGSLNLVVSGATPGVYTFRLNVWPKSGGSLQYDDVIITVGGSSRTVVSKTLVIKYSDGSTKSIENPTGQDLINY